MFGLPLARILGASTAAFALLAGVQTVRLSLEQAAHKNTRLEYASFKTQIVDRTATAIAEERAIRAELEKHRVEQASIADSNYRALFDRYKRVLSETRSGGSAASPSGEDRGAGLPEGAPGDTGLSFRISTDDALICANNTAKAISAYEWAQTLN